MGEAAGGALLVVLERLGGDRSDSLCVTSRMDPGADGV